jgi:hypothetical protein
VVDIVARALYVTAETPGYQGGDTSMYFTATTPGEIYYTWPLGGCRLPTGAQVEIVPPEIAEREFGALVRGRIGAETAAYISAELLYTGTDASTMSAWLRISAASSWTSPMKIFGASRACRGVFTAPPDISEFPWGIIAGVQMRVIF